MSCNHDHKISIFSLCPATAGPKAEWGPERFGVLNFRNQLAAEFPRPEGPRRFREIHACPVDARSDFDDQEISPIDDSPSQNRAIALRERTLTGKTAIHVYKIIKNSEFLNKRPELRDRLSKAFADSEK